MSERGQKIFKIIVWVVIGIMLVVYFVHMFTDKKAENADEGSETAKTEWVQPAEVSYEEAV